MKVSANTMLKTAAVFAVLGALYVARRDAKQAAAAVAGAVDPTSRENIIYRGVNAIFDSTDDGSDNDSFSLGSWWYGVTHGDAIDQAGAPLTPLYGPGSGVIAG